jgi:hypothetical protein
MAPITASAPKMTGGSIELREPSLPVKLLTAGSAACVADLFTYPLDTAKVRLQVKLKHMFDSRTKICIVVAPEYFNDFVYFEIARISMLRNFVYGHVETKQLVVGNHFVFLLCKSDWFRNLGKHFFFLLLFLRQSHIKFLGSSLRLVIGAFLR